MKAAAAVIIFLILMALTFGVEAEDSTLVGTLRVTGEVLTGATGGFLALGAAEKLGVGGANPYKYMGGADQRSMTKAEFTRRLIVDYAALALGSTTGVYLVGILRNETGSFSEEMTSFGSTLGISALSALFVFSGCVFSDMRSDFRGYGAYEMDPWACCTVPMNWAVVTIGAVVGFNITRRRIIPDDSEKQAVKAAPAISFDLFRFGF